ncbi:MAG: protein kinase [Coriobacteriia bacterium]|nr:protein kinase [Coriobacteriia bacterium]
MVSGSWGKFESERVINGALICDEDILSITLLPSEHGSFASGGRLQARLKDGEQRDFHIKVYSYSAFSSEEAMRDMCHEEARTLEALNGAKGYSPRLHLIGTFTDIEGTRYPALVMDRMKGANLYKAMRSGLISGDSRRLPNDRQTIELGLMIARGIQACNQQGITHRDLWPANVLLRMERGAMSGVTLIDYGNSTESLRSTATAAGRNLRLARQNYGAPEIFGISNRQRRKRNAASVDVWSLGALLYFIRTGCEPMGIDPATGEVVDPALIDRLDSTKLRYLSQIKEQPLDLQACLNENSSPQFPMDTYLHWLIAKCTDPAPIARPSIGDLVDEMELLLSGDGDEEKAGGYAFADGDSTPRAVSFTPSVGTPMVVAATPSVGTATMGDESALAAAEPEEPKKEREPLPRWIPATAAAVAVLALLGVGGYMSTNARNHDVSNAIVSGLQPSYPYSADAAWDPKTLTLTDAAGNLMEDGTDYDVTVEDADAVGTATVTVSGKGDYTGTQKATVEISPAPLDKALVQVDKPQYESTGKAVKPKVTVTLGKQTLKEGRDYTVTYRNNTAAGAAQVLVQGEGNYDGTASGAFVIVEPTPKPTPAAAPAAAKPTYSGSSSGTSGSSGSRKSTPRKPAPKKKPSKSDVDISGL